MESRSEIVMVAAFGRGAWLACELAKNYCVTYIDVSDSLCHVEPEDWNGPFPLFESSQIDLQQWDFLTKFCRTKEIDNGFTFWLSRSPWEMRGPLFDFLRKKFLVHETVIQYLRDNSQITVSRRNELKQSIQQKTGVENWLAYFAHQIASTHFTTERLELNHSIALPLLNRCFLREMSLRSIEEYYETLKASGVRLHRGARLEDISIQGRVADGIEIASERSGIVTGKKFLWMITGEETSRFNTKISRSLYLGSNTEPQWCWMRFRIRIQEGPERDVLPQAFVLAKEIHLPWSHANLCFCERTENPEIFRVWMRVAAARRFQRSYLSELGESMISEFRKRIPAIKTEIEQMPQEFFFGFEELGPPRFPVFHGVPSKKNNRVQLSNLIFGAPEDWSGWDWGSRMSAENRMFYSINELFREEKSDDRALHPG